MSSALPENQPKPSQAIPPDAAADADAIKTIIKLTLPRRRPDGATVADTSTLHQRWMQYATTAMTVGQINAEIKILRRSERMFWLVMIGVIVLTIGGTCLPVSLQIVPPFMIGAIGISVAIMVGLMIGSIKRSIIKTIQKSEAPYLHDIGALREAVEMIRHNSLMDAGSSFDDRKWAEANTFGQLQAKIDDSLIYLLGSQMLEYGVFGKEQEDPIEYVREHVGRRMTMLTLALTPFGGGLCEARAYLEAARTAFQKTDGVEL